MTLGKFLFLAAFAALLVWFFVVPSLDGSESREPANGASGSATTSSEDDQQEHDPWTPEERAVWREQINDRIFRR
jgi:hypothetical protein